MAEQILDGTGTGKHARVDSANRLHVHSVNETITENASKNGNAYNVNTGTITLTTAGESSVLYLKNTGENDLHITTVGYLWGNSTGGSGDALAKVIKNPTSGTVISDEVAPSINENKNVGSSNTMSAIVYKGGEAKTITDGTDFYQSLLPGAGNSYSIATGSLVIPKGGSIGVKLTPPSGNTSVDVQVFLSIIEYTLD